jgi:hypothetical protein
MYFPKSQIKSNQYTNGGELQVKSTGQEYKGYYFTTSNGDFYSGKTPDDSPIETLIQIPSQVGKVDGESIPLKNYYVADFDYYNAKNISLDRTAPRAPIQTLGKPTDKDTQNGFFYRYFVKKGNEGRFIEISKEEHLKFQNKDTSIQWQLYTPTRIKWDIQGDREQVYNGNKTVVSLTEQRENLPGFTLFFRGQFDKFWIGK